MHLGRVSEDDARHAPSRKAVPKGPGDIGERRARVSGYLEGEVNHLYGTAPSLTIVPAPRHDRSFGSRADGDARAPGLDRRDVLEGASGSSSSPCHWATAED